MTERRHVDTRTGQVVDNPTIRPFADWLREQSQGSTHNELGEALWDLTQRVQETGKRGTLTLIITMEPLKGGDEGVLMVGDEIRLKLPEFPRKGSIFYTTAQGNLTRKDPDQLEFESLREVPTSPAADVREVGA